MSHWNLGRFVLPGKHLQTPTPTLLVLVQGTCVQTCVLCAVGIVHILLSALRIGVGTLGLVGCLLMRRKELEGILH